MVMVQIMYTTGVSFVIFIVVVFINRLNREVEYVRSTVLTYVRYVLERIERRFRCGSTSIADPSIYLRSLAAPDIDTISIAKTESVGPSSSSSGLTMENYLLVGIPLFVLCAW